MRYCPRCCLPFDADRCPVCGKKSERDAAPDDLCFLTEQGQIWSGMLADVLTQEKIPFLQKNVLGAGITTRIGPMLERVRFYVFYKQLAEARDIVEGLFSSGEESDESCI